VTRKFLLEQAQVFAGGTYDYSGLFRENLMRRIRGQKEQTMESGVCADVDPFARAKDKIRESSLSGALFALLSWRTGLF
jgi:hypothetical protein